MTGIYFEDGINYHIKNEDTVKLISYNNGSKIKVKNSLKHMNPLNNYQKINSEEYVYKPTGEIFYYKKGEFKSKSSIRGSMNKLEDLLRNNFNGGKNEAFITLTYEKREEDFNKTVADLGDFWKSLKKEFQDLEYIGVIENQRLRCSWHIHMLVKDTKHKVLYIPSEEIERIWNKGNVDVARITNKDIKNLVNDSTMKDDENNAINKVIKYMCKTNSKEEIPRNKKSYHRSEGIKFPTVKKMTYSEAQDVINDDNYCLVLEKTLLIKSAYTDKILNKVKEEIYRIDK